jgi:hypothetical protein
MSQCIDRDKRLRELVGTDLPPDELERVARVDALLRITAARELERQGFSCLTPGSATAHHESPHTHGRSREYEPFRAWISGALDGGLSEFESIRMRDYVALRLLAGALCRARLLNAAAPSRPARCGRLSSSSGTSAQTGAV